RTINRHYPMKISLRLVHRTKALSLVSHCPTMQRAPMARRSRPLAFLCGSGSKWADHRGADLHPFWICELFKYCFKSWVRLTNTFSVLNNSFAISEKTGYGKSHRDAMIAEARHARSMQRRRAMDFEPIAELGHVGAHAAQIVSDCRDAISFFYA